MTIIKTALGSLSGIEHAHSFEYRGVPYAQPAEGDLRLAAPLAPNPWQGTLACEQYASAAWQESNALLGITELSLDCLRLNIWVPKGAGSFPVMVWIHGGGYVTGSASQLLYNGKRLAEQQQVIVVNVGYRLGALGFGNFKPWLPQAASNLGLRDQIVALEWVNQHIGNFGGDTNNITVFGESAGGFSVACLLAIKQAQPLFQRAIMQSGAGDMVVSADEAARVAQSLVDELGGAEQLLVADQKAWTRAQRASYRMTIKRGLRDTTPQYGMTWLPYIDNDLLTDLPVNVIRQGQGNTKPLLASVCRDEWNLFQYALPFNGNTPIDKLRDLDEAEVRRRFGRALSRPQDAEQAFALYSQQPFLPQRGRLDWYAALETDRLFIAPTQALLDAHAQAGGAGHACVFTHESTIMGVPVGACHVMDVPLVFDLVDKPVGMFFTGGGEAAQQLAKQVQATWGDFAHGRMLAWANWSTSAQAKVFGPGDELQSLMSAEKAAFWQQILV